jgi:phage shock protein PspC (stress-responsive transcriptional regulator)
MWRVLPRDTLSAMTTTEHFDGATPPPPPPAVGGSAPHRVLRRSREDRIGAGVAGGLGEYFGVDPVLFRVLFATAAFFGGAGVLAYLIAWAAIPEAGTENAPIDRFIAGLRRRRVPVWLVVVVAGVFFWAVAFSWWAPAHFIPLWILVVVLIAVFGRRSRRADGSPPAPAVPPETTVPTETTETTESTVPTVPTETTVPTASTETVSLAKDLPARPRWMDETREWIAESKLARRRRRMRAFPLRIGALLTLVVTIAVLAAIDAASGIALPVYAWVTFGIVAFTLLLGIVLRRTPWSLTGLLVLAVAGIIAFGTTDASLHDGSGERTWTPTQVSDLRSEYRLAFGQGVLDLRRLPALAQSRTVDITLGSGQVQVIVPPAMNTEIVASVHLGQITVDGDRHIDGREAGGFGVNRTIFPSTGATGALLTVNVHLADGEIAVLHRS